MATRAHYVPRFYLAQFVEPTTPPHREPCLWVLDLRDGSLHRRAPKNLAIARGLYDGRGALADDGPPLEEHLAKMETEASAALREFAARTPGARGDVPPQLTRFVAWQAARSISMWGLFREWAAKDSSGCKVVEAPPDGWSAIDWRERVHRMRHPSSDATELVPTAMVDERLREGWHLDIDDDDFRELAHLQAWYFQVRHFPRLRWAILDAPAGGFFVTSDRPCAWGFEGVPDSTPAMLRHPNVQVLAPLTRTVALVAVNRVGEMTPPRAADFNAAVASFASTWIAGPTRDVVTEAARAARRYG